MGIKLKINAKEEIDLTDFTIIDCIKKCEDIKGKNEYLSRNIIAIELFGKYSIFDKAKESLEVDKLSKWSKITAHEKEAYGEVELKQYDTNNKLYDTLTFEKAFIIEYKENYSYEK